MSAPFFEMPPGELLGEFAQVVGQGLILGTEIGGTPLVAEAEATCLEGTYTVEVLQPRVCSLAQTVFEEGTHFLAHILGA